jgi:hypothetical protein
MTLEQLIARALEQINARIALRNTYATELSELRGADTVDEARVEELRSKKAAVDAEITALSARKAELEAEKRNDDAVVALQAQVTPVAPATGTVRDQVVTVTGEARTYSLESDRTGEMFLRDVASDFLGNRRAGDRLSKHMDEERTERGDVITRGVTSGGTPGLVIPQYLVDLYAAKGRPGRKFADQCRSHPLPETGMTCYIPRQTAQTDTGLQVTELTAVTEVDYDDELIPVAIRTAAGSQTLSRQVVERSLGTLDITFEDLLKAYDSKLDSLLLNSAVWGLLAVANTVAYTDADPTAPELYRKILGACATAEDVLQDVDEEDCFTLMRGRRWHWLKGELTDKWPFMAAQGLPPHTFGTSNDAGYPAGVRGYLPDGGHVVTDNNLPANLGVSTTEDVIVVACRQEAHLWEDPSAPLYIRAEAGPSLKSLGIDLVVYGYFAGCFDRIVDAQGTPKSVHQKITGTGLIAPTF